MSPKRFTQQCIGDAVSWNHHGHHNDNNGKHSTTNRAESSIYSYISPTTFNPLSPSGTGPLLPDHIHCSAFGSFTLGLDIFVLTLVPLLKIMRANLWGQWPKVWLLLALLGLALFATDCNGTPVGSQGSRLEKRATQVSLIGYTYTNGVLAGTISVSF